MPSNQTCRNLFASYVVCQKPNLLFNLLLSGQVLLCNAKRYKHEPLRSETQSSERLDSDGFKAASSTTVTAEGNTSSNKSSK
jgi:hypothetical protein